jgi:hypothetical protein
VTPGEDELEGRVPSWSDTIGAAFRQGNLTLNSLMSEDEPGLGHPRLSWDEIKGQVKGTKFERYLEDFVDVTTQSGVDAKKRKRCSQATSLSAGAAG